MSFHLVRLPTIPEDTARKAMYLYGNGNLYIKVGENLNELLNELTQVNISKADMEIKDNRLAEVNTRLALMTSIQYVEKLTDRQLLEALHNRVDLKYALHLPMDYPHFDPLALCKFRQQLYGDHSDLKTFQAFLDLLFVCGFLNTNKEQIAPALDVLQTICTSTRIEKVLESMGRALEILAATYGDWLRMIALPLWYERYSRGKKIPVWPNGNGEWKARTIEVGSDIKYLLGEIKKSHQPGIETLREVRNLSQTWDDQFMLITDEVSHIPKIQWRRQACASCEQ